MVAIENIPPTRYFIDSNFCVSICVFNWATYMPVLKQQQQQFNSTVRSAAAHVLTSRSILL